MDIKMMKRISTWGKILGIGTMVAGGVSALFGLFAMIIGAIPGLVTAVLGYFIYQTGKSAGEYLETQNDGAIASILNSYSKYVYLSGLMFIVSVFIMFFVFTIGGIGIVALFRILG